MPLIHGKMCKHNDNKGAFFHQHDARGTQYLPQFEIVKFWYSFLGGNAQMINVIEEVAALHWQVNFSSIFVGHMVVNELSCSSDKTMI